jgi:ArsR family transcriptional regulator
VNEHNKYIHDSAALLKAVGHPIRLSIILSLQDNHALTVSDLVDLLSIDQPVMSLHLGILRNCNIINAEKLGKQSIYSISNHSIKQIVSVIYNTQK